MTSETHHGRCQCGGVRYVATGALRDVWNCHCKRCQQFTGHHMAATASHPSNVSFESADTLTWYSPDPSVEYGFCRVCGSSLFWRITGDTNKLAICAGTLNAPTGLHTTTAWWVADAADYHVRPALTEYDYEG